MKNFGEKAIWRNSLQFGSCTLGDIFNHSTQVFIPFENINDQNFNHAFDKLFFSTLTAHSSVYEEGTHEERLIKAINKIEQNDLPVSAIYVHPNDVNFFDGIHGEIEPSCESIGKINISLISSPDIFVSDLVTEGNIHFVAPLEFTGIVDRFQDKYAIFMYSENTQTILKL